MWQTIKNKNEKKRSENLIHFILSSSHYHWVFHFFCTKKYIITCIVKSKAWLLFNIYNFFVTFCHIQYFAIGDSPLYTRHGWLGVKNQLSNYLSSNRGKKKRALTHRLPWVCYLDLKEKTPKNISHTAVIRSDVLFKRHGTSESSSTLNFILTALPVKIHRLDGTRYYSDT